MTADAILGFVCALAVLSASFCVGLHQILMGSDRPNYPSARGRVQATMFAWCLVLAYRGVEMLTAAASAQPPHVPPGQLLGSVMVLGVHGTLLELHLRQWLPARIHARIRQLLEIATCSRGEALRRERERQNRVLRPGVTPGRIDPGVTGAALAELQLNGAQVIAPGEGVEALIEPEFRERLARR